MSKCEHRQILTECREAAASWSLLWLNRASAVTQSGFRFPDGRKATAVDVRETLDQSEKASRLVARLETAIKDCPE